MGNYGKNTNLGNTIRENQVYKLSLKLSNFETGSPGLRATPELIRKDPGGEKHYWGYRPFTDIQASRIKGDRVIRILEIGRKRLEKSLSNSANKDPY